jgi:hypothetical protein
MKFHKYLSRIFLTRKVVCNFATTFGAQESYFFFFCFIALFRILLVTLLWKKLLYMCMVDREGYAAILKIVILFSSDLDIRRIRET